MKKYLTEMFIAAVLFVPHFAALLAATACLHESSLAASVIASVGLSVTCSLFRAWGYVEGKEDRP